MKIAIICNTPAAFPLLNWLHSQGVLVGIGTVEQSNDFFSDLEVFSKQRNLRVETFTKQYLSRQLTSWMLNVNAELIFVLGFPFKVPSNFISTVKYGIFNIHFGKLPKYGGSVPVFWQIKNQEKQGVLTIHQMDKSFDTGPIAIELPFDLSSLPTHGILDESYSHMAINGTFQVITSILEGSLTLKLQEPSVNLTFFLKPSLKDLIIDWQKMDASEILALIRACNPWNRGAFAPINGIDFKILEAGIKSGSTQIPGEVVYINENQIEVSCINNSTVIIIVIYASLGFLAGELLKTLPLKPGDVFETISL